MPLRLTAARYKPKKKKKKIRYQTSNLQSWGNGKETFFLPSPIFSVEQCEEKIKSGQRASFSVRITYISTLNKGEKWDPKKTYKICPRFSEFLKTNRKGE